MAKFKKMKLADQTWESVCTAVRNALTASESVEVVSTIDMRSGTVKFEVRAWNDVRKDASNAVDASETTSY